MRRIVPLHIASLPALAGLLIIAAPASTCRVSPAPTAILKNLGLVSLAQAPSFAKRALVIGVHSYEQARPLESASNDARAVAHMLQERMGFPAESITLMTDDADTPEKSHPTYTRLRTAMKTLLEGVDEKSEVVFFFSGHGARVVDKDWLVPEDGDPADAANTCIGYDDFRSQLETRRPRRALLLVDACRNLQAGKGDVPSGFGDTAPQLSPQIAELLSCQPNEISFEGDAEDFREGVFTHFLLEGIGGDPEAATKDQKVTFDSLKDYVHGKVSQYVWNRHKKAQNPDGHSSLGGMVLIEAGRTERPSSLIDDPPAPALAQLAKSSFMVETGMHLGDIARVDTDAAGRYLVTCSVDGTLRVWDSASGKLAQTLRHPGPPREYDSVAISPDGKTVAAGQCPGDGTGGIRIFDRQSGKMIYDIHPIPSCPVQVAFSPDGRYLAALFYFSNGLRIYRTADFSLAAQDTDYANIDNFSFAVFEPPSAGHRFPRLAATANDGFVRLYEVGRNVDAPLERLAKVKVEEGRQPHGLGFSPDGSELAIGLAGAPARDVVLSTANPDQRWSPDST